MGDRRQAAMSCYVPIPPGRSSQHPTRGLSQHLPAKPLHHSRYSSPNGPNAHVPQAEPPAGSSTAHRLCHKDGGQCTCPWAPNTAARLPLPSPSPFRAQLLHRVTALRCRHQRQASPADEPGATVACSAPHHPVPMGSGAKTEQVHGEPQPTGHADGIRAERQQPELGYVCNAAAFLQCPEGWYSLPFVPGGWGRSTRGNSPGLGAQTP